MSLKPESPTDQQQVDEQKKSSSTAHSGTQELKPRKLVFSDNDDDVAESKAPVNQKASSSTELQVEEVETDAERLNNFLKYFITPSYLRKSVFKNLKPFESAKKLPKLPNLPFLHDTLGTSQYLQGLSVGTGTPSKVEKKKKTDKSKKSKKHDTNNTTNYIDIGASTYLELSNGCRVPVNTRVIVDTKTKSIVTAAEANWTNSKHRETSIETEEPTWGAQTFGGYKLRIADTFSQVLSEGPYSTTGYKYKAWVPCSEFTVSTSTSEATDTALKTIPLMTEDSIVKIQETLGDSAEDTDDVPVLLVFGKWKELSSVISADSDYFKDLAKPESLFDGRVRVGRDTRIEDAALIALAKIDGI